MRVFYAEAMEEGLAFGELGEALANPLLPSVDIMVHMETLYPTHYPLTEKDIQDILHKGHGFEGFVENVLDEILILPFITQLYEAISKVINEPLVNNMIVNKQPVYPNCSFLK